MITFRIQPHAVLPGVEIVEIFDGDRLVGALYPHEWGIKLVSKYMSKDQILFSPGMPPVLVIKLP
jgi:hypothetical protein